MYYYKKLLVNVSNIIAMSSVHAMTRVVLDIYDNKKQKHQLSTYHSRGIIVKVFDRDMKVEVLEIIMKLFLLLEKQ